MLHKPEYVLVYSDSPASLRQVAGVRAKLTEMGALAAGADAGVNGFISGHSLRVGSAVSLAQAGASVVDMQVAGRWKSAQMPAHYARRDR